MSTYERVADLPADDRRLRARGPPKTVSSGFERRTTVFRLQGGGDEGARRGRHLRRATTSRSAGARARAPARRRVDVRQLLRAPRRARPVPGGRAGAESSATTAAGAFESAALDLALRQAGRSLAEALGREPQPVTFVVSSRMGEPPTLAPVTRRLARYPDLRFKLDATPDWDDALIDGAGRAPAPSTRSTSRAPTRARRSTPTTDPAFYRRDRRGVPRRVAGGPGPRGRRTPRGAAAVRRPHHLGRADPLGRRHPRDARCCRARSTSSRRASAAARRCSTSTTSARSAGWAPTAAASPSSASAAGRSSTWPRCSIPTRRTTSRRPG